MFICEDCHNKRQARQAIESQPLQWTGHSFTCHSLTNCPDCSMRRKPEFYEYLNAYELTAELDELKTKLSNITDNRPDFLLPMYDSAVDMADRINHFPAILNDLEAMRAVIKYAADLEEVLNVE